MQQTTATGVGLSLGIKEASITIVTISTGHSLKVNGMSLRIRNKWSLTDQYGMFSLV